MMAVSSISSMYQQVVDLLAYGALKNGGSWGGIDCYNHVSLDTHILEDSIVLTILAVMFYVLRIDSIYSTVVSNIHFQLKNSRVPMLEYVIDKLLAVVLIGMYVQLIIYKWNISSLINLVQPCHVILLLQGIAVNSNGSLGILISMFILPSLIGTLLAMLVPDTTGLDQLFERDSYWIQHYLIQVIPIYLLLRRNAIGLKESNMNTIAVGVWILALLHFSFYEMIDLWLLVNVEFMLCPTGSMSDIFNSITEMGYGFIFYPSYRFILFILVTICAITISLIYIAVAKAIYSVFLRKKDKKI